MTEFLAQLVGAKVLKSQGCGRIELDISEVESMKDGILGQLTLHSLSQPTVRVSLEFLEPERNSVPVEVKAPEIEDKAGPSVFAKIEAWYRKYKGGIAYEELKQEIAAKKGKPGFPVKDLHLREMLTEKEAEELLSTLQ